MMKKWLTAGEGATTKKFQTAREGAGRKKSTKSLPTTRPTLSQRLNLKRNSLASLLDTSVSSVSMNTPGRGGKVPRKTKWLKKKEGEDTCLDLTGFLAQIPHSTQSLNMSGMPWDSTTPNPPGRGGKVPRKTKWLKKKEREDTCLDLTGFLAQIPRSTQSLNMSVMPWDSTTPNPPTTTGNLIMKMLMNQACLGSCTAKRKNKNNPLNLGLNDPEPTDNY